MSQPRNDASSAAQKIIKELKSLLKDRGLRYSDVAEIMGVSTMSVKRYLTGKGVTLGRLEALCSAAGVSMLELMELATQESAIHQIRTNAIQEDALAADPKIWIVFYLLTYGWTAERISKAHRIDQVEMNRVLLRLDHLGLIILYPRNRVKVKVRLRPFHECSPALRQHIQTSILRVVGEVDEESPAIWRLSHVRLSVASFARAEMYLKEYTKQIWNLGKMDADLSSEQATWFAFYVLLRKQPDGFFAG